MAETTTGTKQARVKVEETGWTLDEPVPKRARAAWDPTEEELYFRKERRWGPPTPAEEKSAELRAKFEKDRIIKDDGVIWHRTDLKTYHLFRESFFDHRWFRSVYWDERTKRYESRAPYSKGSVPEPVLWEAPDDWTPETRDQFEERRKHWRNDGIRLEHEDAILGAKHELFEHPDHPVVRIIAKNVGEQPPKVLVKLDGSDSAWWIFTDELDNQVLNTKRNIKNWQKRRRTAWKTSGTSIWDTVILEEDPENEGKTPSYPNYRLACSA